ncbi:ABC transporter permease [Methylomonas sp. AM2-LC]|uniref:ABC transporter permease n=1 Tax=Methylomonas sp. AM2-LC TaxID=3153301 RepID=UPI003267E5D0
MNVPKPNWGWASLPFLLLLWIALASRYPSYILPQPWDVAHEAWHWLRNGSLWKQFKVSLMEELGGFVTAVVVALLAGTAGGLSSRFRDFTAPLNSLFMAIPPIAWAPLTMIIFGLGYFSIMLVIFIAAMFPMAVTIQEGVQGIRGGEVHTARTLGANQHQLLAYVYLPASLPFVTAALRIGFSQAWRALVAAEMIGATQGIGWMVSMGGQIGNSSQVLLGIVLIGLIAWLMESLVFRHLEQHYQKWRV